jgi:hypothetical protein
MVVPVNDAYTPGISTSAEGEAAEGHDVTYAAHKSYNEKT